MDIFGIFRDYALHDTELHEIECLDDGIALHFRNGIYQNDENGKETALTPACTMKLKIRDWDWRDLDYFTSVEQIKRKRVVRRDAYKLCRWLKIEPLKIYMQYHSYFGGALLMQGWTSNKEVFFEITEITDISLSFD